MALSNDTIPRTSNRHFRQLEDRVIGDGKLAVGREPGHTYIVAISHNNRPEAVKLLPTRDVRLHPAGGE